LKETPLSKATHLDRWADGASQKRKGRRIGEEAKREKDIILKKLKRETPTSDG